MKMKIVVGAIRGLFVLVISSCILFPAGSPKYRRHERILAQAEFDRVPSEENKQKLINEVVRIRQHENIKSQIALAIAIPAYALYLFWLWRREKKKNVSNTN